MPEINDEFLDVDFTKDPNYVFGDLGFGLTDLCGDYGSTFGELSDAEIDEVIDRMDAEGGGADEYVTRIYDQKQEGSCVANATSQSHEIIQAKTFGLENVVQLSAISLYKRIGSSPNSGAMVSDGLKEMQNRGILPLANEENQGRFDHTMPNTGFRTPFPNGWQETAKRFAGVEAYVVRSIGALMTALCRQEPVVVGRQGHSICYTRPIRRNGRRVVKYANSWHESWGDNGFGYDSQSQISQSARWAFVLRTVTIPT